MTIHAHPSEETLLRYAAGRLPAGPALVVATHLWMCPDCRRQVRAFEALGGAALEAVPAEPLAADAFARVMARIAAAPAPVAAPAAARKELAPGVPLPPPLAGCRVEPWRRLTPKVRFGRVRVPGEAKGGAREATLLHIAAGGRIPEHGHGGVEYTQVITGSYHDQRGVYGPGDLVEVDDDVEHVPVVGEKPCICLFAVEGGLRFKGLLGALLRPFS